MKVTLAKMILIDNSKLFQFSFVLRHIVFMLNDAKRGAEDIVGIEKVHLKKTP